MPDPIRVPPQDPGLTNSPILAKTEGESTVTLDSASPTCQWNGTDYPEGTLVESEGAVYECAFGRWVSAD